jgi:hypothetical protein
MATTTNYSWTTPDDTALVKDGASAIRTLGSSVDTTVKNLNPETTLGDIAYRSSTANVKTRLALGTAGQVLTVNSGATAPEWALPAGGGKSYTLVNAGGTALTGATSITVSGITSAEDILVVVSEASSANATSFVGVRLNSIATGYVQAGYAFTASENGSYIAINASEILLGRTANNAADAVSGSVRISGCSTTGNKAYSSSGGGESGWPGYITTARGYVLNGFVTATATISSITVISSTGNFDNGTVYVYKSA